MKLRAALISCAVFSVAHAQKPALDFTTLENWPTIRGEKINPDGSYAAFQLNNKADKAGRRNGLYIKSTTTSWDLCLPGMEGPSKFTQDGKSLVFLNKDSLGVLQLGTSHIRYISWVKNFQLCGDFLCYIGTGGGALNILHLSSGKEISKPAVTDLQVYEKLGLVVYQQFDSLKKQYSLTTLLLATNEENKFYEGDKAEAVTLDHTGQQVGILSRKGSDCSVWVYQRNTKSLQPLIGRTRPVADSLAEIAGIRGFSKDGSCVLLRMQVKKTVVKTDPQAVKVDIWKYSDTRLFSQRQLEKDRPKFYNLAVSLRTGEMFRLDQPNDMFLWDNPLFCVLMHAVGDADDSERAWNPANKKNLDVVFWKDGHRLSLPFLMGIPSPTGRYFIYYNRTEGNYYSYEVATAENRLLTGGLGVKWYQYGNDNLDSIAYVKMGQMTWLPNDSMVIMQDRFDLWLLDPKGNKSPACLTNGYGKRNAVSFGAPLAIPGQPFQAGEDFIVSAFNHLTKENGFFKVSLRITSDPELLTMGPYVYYVPQEEIKGDGRYPLKAANGNGWLVARMSARSFQNFFYTQDFKQFTQLTDFAPERSVNWLTSELVNVPSPTKGIIQGVLYKPEDFDPSKKYPIIFHYYEKMANNLNCFFDPELFEGSIDIGYMVSRGYLVYTPDVLYTPGFPGKSAYNAVMESLAYLISTRPYIDSSKMGLQGHSFGGFETNYIVTHTNVFKAACAASAVSDLISSYGSLSGAGTSKMGAIEAGQYRMGATLWERRDLYLENTPVLMADKITTPLLLMNNKADDAVPFAQGVEMFLALRRLQKKGWMLQYDNSRHTLSNHADQLDYTIRVMQFFDHYLKGAPPARWMVQGISANKKGVDDGLDLVK